MAWFYSLFAVVIALVAVRFFIQPNEKSRLDPNRWTNYNKQWGCHFQRGFLPSSEAEIQEVLSDARRARATVRVVGSGYAADNLICDGRKDVALWLVSLERFARVLSWSDDSVEVEAGITVRALALSLKQRGLQLPAATTFDEQTLVGAVSVGTKDVSCHMPALVSAVKSYTLLLANGTILRDVNEVRQPELFHACLVAMGMCGVITSLQLRVEAEKFVLAQNRVASFARVASEAGTLEQKLTTQNYARAFWIPHTDHFSLWTADIVWADKQDNRGGSLLPFWLFPWARSQLLSSFGVLTGSFPWLAVHTQPFIAFAEHTAYLLPEAAKPLSEALWSPAPRGVTTSVDYFVDMKAFPISKVLTALKEALNTTASSSSSASSSSDSTADVAAAFAAASIRAVTREPLFDNYLVEVYFTKSNKFYLSPAYSERDTVFATFSCALLHQSAETGERFVKLLDVVFRQFHARANWNARSKQSLTFLKAIYARYEDFVTLRRQLDPRAMFLNSHLATQFS